MLKIMLVDDDKVLNGLLTRYLENERNVVPFYDVSSAVSALRVEKFDVVLSDVMLPDGSGIDILREVKRQLPDAFVILMTGHANIDDAITAIKDGAMDYLVKPITYDMLEAKLGLIEENTKLRSIINEKSCLEPIGCSASFLETLALARRVAATDTATLITGETGTGKGVIAKYIHDKSRRSSKLFIQVNCANFQENIFESELFGYKKGAFTGATSNKDGIAAMADKGTLFFDEVSEIPLNFQAKLLKFLDDKMFLPLGATQYRHADVRVIAATNANLPAMVREGRFREDLYYRLNVINISIMPLRERREDILPLANHFLDKFKHINPLITGLSQDATKILENYKLPGNIRELSNMIERAMILEQSTLITLHTLNINSIENTDKQDESDNLEVIEKKHILKVLAKYSDDKSKTAAALGIDRATLYRKLKEYGSV